jgi:hypothetical protein
MTRRPNNLTESLGALVQLVAEMQTVRGEIERAASSASDMTHHLRELFGDRGAHHRVTVTVGLD